MTKLLGTFVILPVPTYDVAGPTGPMMLPGIALAKNVFTLYGADESAQFCST